jgi:hypothetical protein
MDDLQLWTRTTNPVFNIWGPHDTGKTTTVKLGLTLSGANPDKYPGYHGTTETVQG